MVCSYFIRQIADNERALYGAEIENVAGSGVKIPGSSLEQWRREVIEAADKQGITGEYIVIDELP